MRPETQVFETAVQAWGEAATAYAQAREDYRLAHAKATLVADGKSAEARKAQADSSTSELRLTRDRLEVRATAAYHRMVHLRGVHDARAEVG